MKAAEALPPEDLDAELPRLLEAIYREYSHDFREYSGASLRRRVAHALSQFNLTRVSALREQILRDPTAFMQLLQYLTVPVSEMFRDPDYFLALRRQVAPLLQTYPSIKVWVAGCSSGEEVYSIAILLHEEGLLERAMLYATDINPVSIEKARRGIFSLDHLQAYSQNYQKAGGKRSLSDYYTAGYGGVIVERSLREKVTFADHSLATDSVFAETHLISCRNVLIYFNRQLQDRALGLFQQSLCRRGFLGLGSKETIDFSAHASAFDPVDRAARIYRTR